MIRLPSTVVLLLVAGCGSPAVDSAPAPAPRVFCLLAGGASDISCDEALSAAAGMRPPNLRGLKVVRIEGPMCGPMQQGCSIKGGASVIYEFLDGSRPLYTEVGLHEGRPVAVRWAPVPDSWLESYVEVTGVER